MYGVRPGDTVATATTTNVSFCWSSLRICRTCALPAPHIPAPLSSYLSQPLTPPATLLPHSHRFPLPTPQPSSFDDYGGLEGGGMAGGGGGYDGDGAAPSEAPVPFMRPPPAGEE